MFLVIFLLSFLVKEFQKYTLFWLLYAFKYFLMSLCNCLKHSIFLKILSIICGKADLTSSLQYLTIAGYSSFAFFLYERSYFLFCLTHSLSFCHSQMRGLNELILVACLEQCLVYSWRRAWQPLQYSCLKNPMDKGAQWATIMGSQRVRHD